MNKKQDFSTTVVRIYDKELLDKLRAEYVFSGGRYESKNHMITELIEAGLANRRDDGALWDKLKEADGAIAKSVAALTERVAELEKCTRFWMSNMDDTLETNQRILGAVYALAEAANDGERLAAADLESGYYDFPPDRFTKSAAELLEETKK